MPRLVFSGRCLGLCVVGGGVTVCCLGAGHDGKLNKRGLDERGCFTRQSSYEIGQELSVDDTERGNGPGRQARTPGGRVVASKFVTIQFSSPKRFKMGCRAQGSQAAAGVTTQLAVTPQISVDGPGNVEPDESTPSYILQHFHLMRTQTLNCNAHEACLEVCLNPGSLWSTANRAHLRRHTRCCRSPFPDEVVSMPLSNFNSTVLDRHSLPPLPLSTEVSADISRTRLSTYQV
jgi:hypothetical protein